MKAGKDVMYITERAVFRLTSEGLVLEEYAPGIDIEKDVLAKMEFKPWCLGTYVQWIVQYSGKAQ